MRSRVDIKTEAKEILRSAKVSPILITLIVMAIAFVLNRVMILVEYGTLFPIGFIQRYADAYQQAFATGDVSALQALAASLPESTTMSFFFSTLVSLFMVILNAGYFIYCMGIRQGVEMPYSTLTEGLSVAGKLIWCWVQLTVRTFLWSMLFIIPGIVAAYRYRFAYYNLLTASTLSAGEAIRLSCQQTAGIKMDLFVLDLSFIGWLLLSAITMSLLDMWLTPYITLCDLAYFEDAQKRLGRSPYNSSQTPPSSGEPWEL